MTPVWTAAIYTSAVFNIALSVAFIRMSKKLRSHNDIQKADSQAKYHSIHLNSEKTEEIKRKITDFILKEKPYLKLDYSLSDLANDLKILPNQLSMVINSQLKCTFPEYLNSLRIEAALERLNKVGKNSVTIEAIAYESGFNNRTSFYKAFKKQTGRLPSEYLKIQTQNTKGVG